MNEPWVSEEYEIAMVTGPRRIRGFTYRGLGLACSMGAYRSKKGRKVIPARWTLSHLGTGHSITILIGELASVLPIATEIAEAGEWDFLSIDGWRDRFPDAKGKLDVILARHEGAARRPGGTMRCDEVARAIAANRP